MSAFGDFTVARTTVKYVLNASGVLASVAADTPAFEFNADGTYRGLLVEPAGTNLVIRSDDFANASWTKDRTSISSNVLASPDGTTTADELIEDVQTGPHHTNIAFTVADSTTVTASFFVKANTRLGCAIAIRQKDGATLKYAYFNLSTGAVTTADAGYTGAIQAYPNGWYRCSITGDSGVGGLSARAYCFMLSTATSTSTSYTGDGTSSLYVWGAQAETGAVATSYIPTVASTETRTADSVSLTGASSLIGQTEGTMFVEFERGSYASDNTQRLFSVSDDTTDNRISLIVLSTTSFGQLLINTATVSQATIGRSIATSGINKFAVAYALNDIAFYANGSSVGTDTLATIPATSQVNLGINEGATPGTENFNGWIRAAVLYPTRLSNAQLQALTT
jgi:hypothetical protein